MELYRRDFEFIPPVMPQEEESDDSDGMNQDDTQHEGKNEIINGIEINSI